MQRVVQARTQATQGVRGVGREHVAHVVDAARAGARHSRDVLRRGASMRSPSRAVPQSGVSFLLDLTVPDPNYVLHRDCLLYLYVKYT